MEQTLIANRFVYLGIFFITLTTLMHEILLTRIFSVVSYYHFAFMAISIVMFGLTVGALLVYLLPQYQNHQNAQNQLTYASLFFGISILLSILPLLFIPFQFELSLSGLLQLSILYLILSIPFIFSGICVCLVLTKFKYQTNSLYAADLIGAGLGCISIIFLLNHLNGPSTILATAAIGIVSSYFFSKNSNILNLNKTILYCLGFYVALLLINIQLDKFNASPWRLNYVKNSFELRPLYEKWNSFSRVTVTGNERELSDPFFQGPSDTYPNNEKIRNLTIQIDANAATALQNYHHKLDEINYLKYDITSFAHYLKPNAKTLVIGVGGGRDILSALAFQQPYVVGVELNPNIIDILTNKFANFSGHIDQDPHVKLINDEARSYIARSTEKFDIIQISLIDTWAATAAGAYALSENALYTTHAWEIFLKHLSPDGLLTVTRWYDPSNPGEIYRLTTLASQTLTSLGIKDPQNHIMIFSSSFHPQHVLVGNVIVSPKPFTLPMILAAKKYAQKLNYPIVYLPHSENTSLFTELAANQHIEKIENQLNMNISAPTDNKPFFFELMKLQQFFVNKFLHNPDLSWEKNRVNHIETHAIEIMFIACITVTLLTLCCIVMPLFSAKQKISFKNISPFLIYFGAIGLGFMFIEIAQLQRLVLFLGSPTYGLSVVLFSLLISCGLGSAFISSTSKSFILNLCLMLIALLVAGYFTNSIVQHYESASTSIRIAISIAILFPVGFCMGFAFPIGMQIANYYSPSFTPWLWGINGATSICASVFAMLIALTAGISAAYWCGVGFYLLAFLAYVVILNSNIKKYTPDFRRPIKKEKDTIAA